MTDPQLRLQAFVKLGNFFRDYLDNARKIPEPSVSTVTMYTKFDEIVERAGQVNGWFTRENVLFALKAWANLLTEPQLSKWMAPYSSVSQPRTVAIIMAGNIPLVGFHDFLAVLISGNRVLVKLSSNDSLLLPFIARQISLISPGLAASISFTEDRLKVFDAVIATGSTNTSRYFEYYFREKPHIIRKNRTSIGVLSGNESRSDLTDLGSDIFTYFGLGCRNVSKLYVPQSYDFTPFFETIMPYERLLHHTKYANNYDYNKAVYLMSDFPFRDNGFMMLREDPGYGSPIATLFYEYYPSTESIRERVEIDREQLQCIVADDALCNAIPFGSSQFPGLSDYADGIDTMAFLQQLSL